MTSQMPLKVTRCLTPLKLGVSLQPPPFLASGCPVVGQGSVSPYVPDQARRWVRRILAGIRHPSWLGVSWSQVIGSGRSILVSWSSA